MSTEHFNLTLRQATESDAELLLEWRNDASTRAFSISSEEVAREKHNEWLSRTLQDNSCLLVVGEVLGDPVGMVRINFNFEANLGQVSINMNPDFRGKGLSKKLLGASLSNAIQAFDNVSRFYADIHIDNLASQKIFSSLGFAKVSVEQENGFESYSLNSDSLVVPK